MDEPETFWNISSCWLCLFWNTDVTIWCLVFLPAPTRNRITGKLEPNKPSSRIQQRSKPLERILFVGGDPDLTFSTLEQFLWKFNERKSILLLNNFNAGKSRFYKLNNYDEILMRENIETSLFKIFNFNEGRYIFNNPEKI